jgi:hypothetical protein
MDSGYRVCCHPGGAGVFGDTLAHLGVVFQQIEPDGVPAPVVPLKDRLPARDVHRGEVCPNQRELPKPRRTEFQAGIIQLHIAAALAKRM